MSKNQRNTPRKPATKFPHLRKKIEQAKATAKPVKKGKAMSGVGVGHGLRPIVRAILDEYTLPLNGIHGPAHWARVLENGLRLAKATGASLEVVQLFALFHDSKRVNECTDPDHGQRGAEFAAELRGTIFDLPNHDFNLLYRACTGHTHERTHPDITIQTCWDSDRLDLGRVGIMPHPSRLCTDAAKQKEMIQWADGRASFEVVPDFVASDWGLDLVSCKCQADER